MQSAFFGVNVATQGLFTYKTALDITNHNISNAETDGYSRQYGVQKATRALPYGRRGMIGTGTEITNVSRYRSDYLDKKYWGLNTTLGEYTIKDNLMGKIETIFNELSDEGLSFKLDDIYKKLQSFSVNPAEAANRNNFISAAVSFADFINNQGQLLRDFQKDANAGIKVSVERINALSSQIATVNNQIADSELFGDDANDLRDERVRLMDELAGIVNVEGKEITDINGKKSFKVLLDGNVLVDDNVSRNLEVKARNFLKNPEDQINLYDIYWENGSKLYLSGGNISGKLRGYLDVRDGNNGNNFTGDIAAGLGTTTVTIENFNRHDLPPTGEIKLDNQTFEYTSYSYDNVAVPKQMVFNLTTAAPAAATTATSGESIEFKGIPHYIKELNEFTRTFSKAFNEIHKMGAGGNSQELFSFTGYTDTVGVDELLENDLSTYDQITIFNFTVDERMIDNTDLLETSATVGAGESANDILVALSETRQDNNMFAKGKPENFLQSIIGSIGVDAKQANNLKKGQTNLQALIDNQRESYSGVDVNEEATDMIRFQQAYNLSAKMVSVMDEIYDVTINQLKR